MPYDTRADTELRQNDTNAWNPAPFPPRTHPLPGSVSFCGFFLAFAFDSCGNLWKRSRSSVEFGWGESGDSLEILD